MKIRYILVDHRHMEVSVVSKLPDSRKGFAIHGKYAEGTNKGHQEFVKDLALFTDEYRYKQRQPLTCLIK